MICKNCGAKLKGNPHKCPLCDTVFFEKETSVKKRKRGLGLYKNPFTPIYIFTVLAVVVILFFVAKNLGIDHSLWIAVLFGGSFVYFLIAHTVMGMRNYTSKLMHLSVAVCIYMIILFETTNYKAGYGHIYLAVQAGFFLVSLAFFVFSFKVFKPYISSFLIQTVFSFVPLLIVILDKGNYIAPLVIACVESVFSAFILIKFPKEILNQIKRFFAS